MLICMDLDDAACRERGARIAGHADRVRTLARAVHPAPLALMPHWADLPLPLQMVRSPGQQLTLELADGRSPVQVSGHLGLVS